MPEKYDAGEKDVMELDSLPVKEDSSAPIIAKFWGKALLICLIVTSICLVITIVYDWGRIGGNLGKLNEGWITLASIVILSMLISIYLYAYNLYKRDLFFAFVAISWLLNLCYMIFIDGWYSTGSRWKTTTLLLIQVLLSFSSDFYLYLANSVKAISVKKDIETKEYFVNLKSFIIPSSFIIIWLIVFYIIPENPTFDLFKIKILFIIAPLYSIYVLSMTAITIRSRFEPDETSLFRDDDLAFLLQLTFVLYAVLQIPFVFNSFYLELVNYYRPYSFIIAKPEAQMFYQILYVITAISVFLKLVNGTALLLILQKRYAKLFSEREVLAADLKYANRVVEKERELLTQRNRFEDLGVLTASIEHEIRTPLSAINSALISMKKKFQADEKLVEYIDRLQTERRKILEAANMVNILSAATEEDLPEPIKEIDVEDFINRVIKNVKNELSKKTSNVNFKVNPHKENLFVKGYPFLLEKVFINFTKNAVESVSYTNKAGLVTFDLDVDGRETVKISISDNGTGFIDSEGNKIPDAELNKIIDAGYSTKLGRDSKANRGMGLFVADRLVKLNKGIMKFENLKDGGAKVSVMMERYFTHKMRKQDDTDS